MMGNKMKFQVIIAVILWMSCPAAAFWRLLCHGQLGVARIDPIVSFNATSSHAHTAHGASNFGITATADDLMQSNCTSCSVTQDRSAYWTPPLYYAAENGSFYLVPQLGGMTAYYFTDTDKMFPNETITAFPKGFRMISGDNRQRNFTLPIPDPPMSFWTANDTTQSALAQKAIGFNCLNYAKNYTDEGALQYHYIRSKTFIDEWCADGLRLELMFPSCWDGVNLDSKDHKSHIMFPEWIKTGPCPRGFPVRMPALFYETIYNVWAFQNQPGSFVLANGDPTGYGYHGDFIAGWDPTFLQNAINVCTNNDGLEQDCPLFNIQNETSTDTCKMTLPDSLKNEDTVGPLKVLPGKVQLQYGPAYATLPTAAYPSSAVINATAPTKTYGGMSVTGPSGRFITSTSQSIRISSITSLEEPLNDVTTSLPDLADATSTAVVAYSTITYTTNGAVVELVEVIEEVFEHVTNKERGVKRHMQSHMHHH